MFIWNYTDLKLYNNDVTVAEDALKMNEYGVSEAKILFVKKAIEQNPELNFDDLIYLPTREIAKYIEGYEDVNTGNQGENNQNNQGNGNQNHGNKNWYSLKLYFFLT